MRICRYAKNKIGLVKGNLIHDVSHIADRLGAFKYPLPRYDLMISRIDDVRRAIEELTFTTPGVPVDTVALESPVANPGKIIAAPVNYKKHFDEAAADPVTFPTVHVRSIGESGLFLKATSSVVGPAEGITRRFPDRRTDHEVELAVIIGKECGFVPEAEALSVIAGYCVGLDMTIRGSEDRSFRKSPDSYTVLGPWLVTADEIADASALDMTLSVNGKVRQHANTRDLIFGIPRLISLASSFYNLHPGDVIMTGTPEGVGEVVAGDVLVASIEGVGVLKTHVH
jgi:2-keto-4-pentenoate hydratase/2-oxohepta-3-ene-1,7-dioic acid hydratase in catechol pathway